MKRRLLVAGCVAACSLAFATAQSRSTVASPATLEVGSRRALVDQYCVGCHNTRLKTANLMLDQLDLAHLGENAEIGEKVVRKLRAGMMPPKGVKRPDSATMDSFVKGMEDELDRNL